MQVIPSYKQVKYIRECYPAGTRVELISMDDPYSNLKAGDRGTIQGVDDMGSIMVHWECGSSLSLIPGVDRFKVL